jgi:Natural resistance-associated macrophage protein-like
VLFAIALIDACIIGASAVSLSTAYAIGDVLALRHSLHRKPTDAKGFYAVYFGLIAISAAVVLTPGTPLGLLTNAVQTLAGVLLPGATVFLLLLCNDKAVLGPWANTFRVNIFTGAVIAVLVMLSVILTASVLFPNITGAQIVAVLLGGSALALVATIALLVWQRRRGPVRQAETVPLSERATWRMPPLAKLPRAELTVLNLAFLSVLRGYLFIAGGLVLVRIAQLISAGH